MSKSQIRRSLHTGLLALAAVSSTACNRASAEEFYKGKVLSIIVPASPGGSYDLYARLVSNHMVRHIPGGPTAVIQHMPGAGGLRAINYMFSVAAKDGTVLQVPIQDIALSEALNRDGVAFKVREFNWIGRLAPSVDLSLSWHTSRVRTIADAQAHAISMAATGPNSPTTTNLVALNALIGTRFNIIQGYKSSADMSLAMERGETEGSFATWATMKTAHANWIKERKVNYLVVYSTERLADLPDVPAVVELARSEEDRQVLALIASTATLGRSLLTTPGVDTARVKLLRSAFDTMILDPVFTSEVKRLNVEFDPLPGDRLQQQLSDLLQVPPTVLARAQDILGGSPKRGR